ncbi:cysteine--tRNA ligase [Marinicella sp. S1101]|uniref:cysteine--tRNA ligase n=1 Tax=Marinicella marina TaxID=2996016 RepID=UPI002260FCCC|nr:cysteine--tRNA ligase [Marinicella marina]MCX7554835.1 cysteine--tRNA ligase [Marinicella marina]MDJ1140932.1 cysteine--tRNA ligase [Marinicella marina]
MALYLHNTLSGNKEQFKPIDPNRVTMYLCGPTVYNYAHIGNARPAVVFDVLNRLLRHHYPHVVFARNITDIDDKINNSAKALNCDIKDISSKYAAAYNEDLKALGVLMPDIEPHATDHLVEMIDMIEVLIEKGHAYESEGHVLFDVTTYDKYGKLSNRSLDDMLAGARVEVASYKRNPGDFILWKPSDDSLPGWDSPWDRGRPGWHIECSAMAAKHLAETIDIHCGGKDLIFPHHENEVAQSCCANNTQNFANYWVHNGFITMSDQKMSKSLGNIQLIREVLAEIGGEVARWVLLSAHYRQSVDWTPETVAQASKTIDRIYSTLRDVADLELDASMPVDAEILSALDDDINTPKAFARINQLAKQLANAEGDELKTRLKSTLLNSAALLGVLQTDPEAWFAQKQSGGEDIKEQVEQLIAARNQARADKDWAKSDEIRDELDALGVVLEDSPEGTRWSMKS